VTTFWLLRHAAHDWLGRGIAGRQPDVSLNAAGEAQAQGLVQRFAAVPLAAICCSPQPRTQQTAAPLARSRGLTPEVVEGVDEVDMGDWEGRSFDELRALGEPWRHWVERRASAHPPGGEPFAGVARRAMGALRILSARHPDEHVMVVSHGDVLKSIVADALGLSLDHLERFDIAPASATVLAMGEDWMQLRLLNAQGAARPDS
jgi:probable phosphoglycerate mutase